MNQHQYFLNEEFDRQVRNLKEKQVCKLADIDEKEFFAAVEELRPHLNSVEGSPVGETEEWIPFAIVIKNNLINSESIFKIVEREGLNGVVKLNPLSIDQFKVTVQIVTPNSPVYLIIDVIRGSSTKNIPPLNALNSINKLNLTPLTIEEGVSVVLHHPNFLARNNCFSLLGSRTGVDKRVPAIWLNSKNEPNLGWCWEGAPHTWLGSAACRRRLGVA